MLQRIAGTLIDGAARLAILLLRDLRKEPLFAKPPEIPRQPLVDFSLPDPHGGACDGFECTWKRARRLAG